MQRTLEQLRLLASIRGDAAEDALLSRARAIVQARQIEAESDLGPLFEDPGAPAEAADVDSLKRLRQIYEAGGWVLLESTLADLPADLRWLYESGAVTLEQLAALHHRLGVTSAADLAAAVSTHAIRSLDGFDEALESAVAAALPTLRATIPRIPLGRGAAIADPLINRLESVAGVVWAGPAGSLRRGKDMLGDIELVAATSRPNDAIDELLRDPDVVRSLHRGSRRVYLLIDRVQVGVRLPDPANAGSELLYLTGSARHFQALQAHAAGMNRRLTPAGLIGPSGELQTAATEDEIYTALGLPPIPPEIRQGDEEIAAAARHELPPLVAREHIRGDLHMHTVWSDGRDPVETMVEACRALRYEYIAITDHSPTAAGARSLTVDGVRRQADEIQELRSRYPDIVILHGCEADILPDGRLDFPDKVLEGFDIVLASLHERVGHSRDELMKRYTLAMKHPLVTIVTHPTNRLFPHRPGYDLDYDRLFEIAVETRTVLEVDGSPSHLDLDGALARRAVRAGALLSIDSDSHRADLLNRQMHLGLLTARRGWVEPRHVLNTRPIGEVRAFIAAKRAAR